MRPLADQLQREVASLYSFLESVACACSPPPQAVSYSESSSRFFDYINHLAEATKKHIAGFERHANDEDEDFLEARTELWSLRSAWRTLHQFIKPSADADTLSQPTAMVAALVARLHEVKGFESTNFTIFHTDSFDYAQVSPSATEDAVAQLARIIETDPFPPDLGLIGMPNSQGTAVFMNCLLAHEIGEYAYAKRRLDAVLAVHAEAALTENLGADFSTRSLPLQKLVTKAVLQWAKEVFCDLFAVRLVGPCYSFAYIELFDLPNLLNKDGTLVVGEDAKPQITFYRAHPSHPFRVRAQSELLKEEGWLDLIKDLDSRQSAVLRGLQELSLDAFIEAEQATADGRAPWVQSLIDIMPEVKKQLGSATDGIDPRLHEYRLLWKPIAEYLRSGIVPSTLNVEVEPGSGKYQVVRPTPITLLNASYRFYLGRL